MKRSIKLIGCLLLLLCISVSCLSGCGKPAEGKQQELKIAFVTGASVLEDGAYHKGIWTGIEAFCKKHEASCRHYAAEQFAEACSVALPVPEEDEASGLLLRETAMKKAVEEGAEVLICAGDDFSLPVFHMQQAEPEIAFLLIDAEPRSEQGEVFIGPHTRCAYFAEEEAGFMAGYAIVRDGEKKLGFMGGRDDPSVCRFGYGFVQGAEAAAKEMKLEEDAVSILYTYTGTYSVDPAVLAQASKWYKSGIGCIFACGGEMGKSVMHAAEAANGKVIGVDVDQSALSKTVVTSAKKNLSAYVQKMLNRYQNHMLVGGETDRLTAREKFVSLELKNSRFQVYDEAAHQAFCGRLREEPPVILTPKDVKKLSDLPLEYVDLDEEKKTIDLLGEESSEPEEDEEEEDSDD